MSAARGQVSGRDLVIQVYSGLGAGSLSQHDPPNGRIDFIKIGFVLHCCDDSYVDSLLDPMFRERERDPLGSAHSEMREHHHQNFP